MSDIYPEIINHLCGRNHDPSFRKQIAEAWSCGRGSMLAERDKLQAENERLTKLASDLVGEEELHQDARYETEMQNLEAEIKRLRNTLENITEADDGIARDIARNALKTEE